MVTLNRIVAVAMVHGPDVALAQLDTATADPALAGHHRVDAIRAHLLERLGDTDAARTLYRCAARRTLSIPEQRYLLDRATSKDVGRLRHPGTAPGPGADREERS
jgi:predicted RNA polymerase sigma factor